MVQPAGSEPVRGQLPLTKSSVPTANKTENSAKASEVAINAAAPTAIPIVRGSLAQAGAHAIKSVASQGGFTSGPMTNEQITNSMFTILNQNDTQDPHHVSYQEVEKQVTAMFIKNANEGQMPAGYNNLTDMLTELKAQYEKADVNGDGNLNIDEFSTLMEKTHQFDPSLGWHENSDTNKTE